MVMTNDNTCYEPYSYKRDFLQYSKAKTRGMPVKFELMGMNREHKL